MSTLNVTGLSANRRYRLARETAGFKQEELARIVGVARTTIGEWERGVTEPSASRLVRLADATRQPLDFFVEGLREDLRARRDSNPQPSDWESVRARLGAARRRAAVTCQSARRRRHCQGSIDTESHHLKAVA